MKGRNISNLENRRLVLKQSNSQKASFYALNESESIDSKKGQVNITGFGHNLFFLPLNQGLKKLQLTDKFNRELKHNKDKEVFEVKEHLRRAIMIQQKADPQGKTLKSTIIQILFQEEKNKEKLIQFMKTRIKQKLLSFSPQGSQEICRNFNFYIYKTVEESYVNPNLKCKAKIQEEEQLYQERKAILNNFSNIIEERSQKIRQLKSVVSSLQFQEECARKSKKTLQEKIQSLNEQLHLYEQKKKEFNKLSNNSTTLEKIQDDAKMYKLHSVQLQTFNKTMQFPRQTHQTSNLPVINQQFLKEINILAINLNQNTTKNSQYTYYKLQTFIKRIIRTYQTIINRLLEICEEKHAYIKKFQEKISHYFHYNVIKQQTIHSMKNQFAMIWGKVQNIFIKSQKNQLKMTRSVKNFEIKDQMLLPDEQLQLKSFNQTNIKRKAVSVNGKKVFQVKSKKRNVTVKFDTPEMSHTATKLQIPSTKRRIQPQFIKTTEMSKCEITELKKYFHQIERIYMKSVIFD